MTTTCFRKTVIIFIVKNKYLPPYDSEIRGNDGRKQIGYQLKENHENIAMRGHYNFYCFFLPYLIKVYC